MLRLIPPSPREAEASADLWRSHWALIQSFLALRNGPFPHLVLWGDGGIFRVSFTGHYADAQRIAYDEMQSLVSQFQQEAA
ncbi:MAG: hypothetical protein IT489_03185 [Gammaproteobacteria bacterium]|nr:hypothetical protein [Gammaproteobacteria bacterium]